MIYVASDAICNSGGAICFIPYFNSSLYLDEWPPLSVLDMYSLVIWISTGLSLLVFGYSLQPKIGIGAVFESIDYNHYNGVFYR